MLRMVPAPQLVQEQKCKQDGGRVPSTNSGYLVGFRHLVPTTPPVPTKLCSALEKAASQTSPPGYRTCCNKTPVSF